MCYTHQHSDCALIFQFILLLIVHFCVAKSETDTSKESF